MNEPNSRSPILEDIGYWRLTDELTVVQAALLVADEDPGTKAEMVESLSNENRPPRYEAAKQAIKTALLKEQIKGELVHEEYYDQEIEELFEQPGTVDIFRSRVNVESLRGWLESRGFDHGFFFPQRTEKPDYMDRNHEHYAPKLAAAVGAWLATVDNSTLQGKHPKQALMKWLRENAADYEITDGEGNPQEYPLEEIAKIANWKPTGGAPKTPGQD